MTSYLITGGTGFFGQAFVRRLLDTDASDRICIYSRGEHAQAGMRDRFGDDPRLRFFIGDVRDQARLKRAMRGVDVVVHAAALKRIEVGRYNPIEMIRTNVDGAVNVIEAAQDAQVGKVVALSTDKACEPISPYGQSKALAESLFLAANDTVGDGPQFAVTRYGNVWWSTGSVGPRWLELIQQGIQRVPVTDPNCTRFFMTADQAVDLVLDTIHFMPRTVAVPTLPAYRLETLADAFGVDMDVRGLPDWEKMHEKMAHDNCSADARMMTTRELQEAIPA